jgi:hypothetical protein
LALSDEEVSALYELEIAPLKFFLRSQGATAEEAADAASAAFRARYIADHDAAFNFRAGLEEIYRRAGRDLPHPPDEVDRSPSEDAEAQGAVDEVCQRIEMLDALLATARGSEPGIVLPGYHLTNTRRLLLQLRMGLKARSLDRAEAGSLISNVQRSLREADRALRHQHGLSLDEALSERIGELQAA